MFNSFFLKAKSIFIITLYSMFNLLDTVVFPVSIALLGIYAIVRGVKLFYLVILLWVRRKALNHLIHTQI